MSHDGWHLLGLARALSKPAPHQLGVGENPDSWKTCLQMPLVTGATTASLLGGSSVYRQNQDRQEDLGLFKIRVFLPQSYKFGEKQA